VPNTSLATLLGHTPVCHAAASRARATIPVMHARNAVAILSRRFADKAADEERCAREIKSAIPAVVEVLASEFGARRVVLFGSLARGEARPDSDIDLAVEGLPPTATFRAMARAAEVAGRHVDLVPLEGVRPEVLAIIEREGEVFLGGPAGAGSPRAA
jgi:predicted nucleotidyltransferase